MNWLTSILVIVAGLGSTMLGGIFFAFSAFIMNALKLSGEHEGPAVMRKINEVILRSWFMPVFLTTPLLCLLLITWHSFQWSGIASMFVIIGCIVQIAGSFLVTVLFNVPLNNRLAGAANTPAENGIWNIYLTSWTAWNHVRTAACMLSAALLIVSLLFPYSER